MKKVLIILIISLLSVNSVWAKDKNEDPKCKATIYMKGDSVIEGNLADKHAEVGTVIQHLIGYPNTYDTTVSLEKKQKKLLSSNAQSIDIEKIDSMVTVINLNSTCTPINITYHWYPMYVNIAYGNEANILDHISMIARVYKGKSVDFYFGENMAFGNIILYRTKDMDIAKALFKIKDKLSEKRKKTLALEFARYPEIVPYIQSLGKTAISENPKAFYEKIDELISKNIK